MTAGQKDNLTDAETALAKLRLAKELIIAAGELAPDMTDPPLTSPKQRLGQAVAQIRDAEAQIARWSAAQPRRVYVIVDADGCPPVHGPIDLAVGGRLVVRIQTSSGELAVGVVERTPNGFVRV